MTDLLILADRVEGLSGPIRTIEREIAQAVLGDEIDPISATPHAFCPAYTASLDSAESLIPADVQIWCLIFDGDDCEASITDWDGGEHEGKASTAPLALTAACLRTIAANQENPL